jgi:cytochrome P450
MGHPKPAYDPVSVAPLAFWSKDPRGRDEELSILRRERPLSWHPPAEGSMMEPEEQNDGFWAVTSNALIKEVSTRPEDFCSGHGITLEEVPTEILETVSSFLAMDAPRHTALRKLVSTAFTPRRVKIIEDQIHERAVKIVDDLLEKPEGDFVHQVSMRLPMQTIFDMMGVPEEFHADTVRGVEGMVAWADEDVRQGLAPEELLMESLLTLLRVATTLIADRRANPQDDLMTSLVQAEVDGSHLTEDEIAGYFCLLAVAGNDTTRNTTSQTAKALTDFPEARKLLLEDFDGRAATAVEEMVRWATPVMTFRRTATRDCELNGLQISEGDWLGLFYESGNRDEAVFADPWTFDVLRNPNPHVGFGGGGPHFCMGSMLAKTQLRHLWKEILTRAPNFEVGEPEYLVGNFMCATKRLPYKLNL